MVIVIFAAGVVVGVILSGLNHASARYNRECERHEEIRKEIIDEICLEECGHPYSECKFSFVPERDNSPQCEHYELIEKVKRV